MAGFARESDLQEPSPHDGIGSLPFLPWLDRFVRHFEMSPAQLAVARVFGGGDPETEDERRIWGFTGLVATYQRTMMALRIGRRGFKTSLCAWRALWRAFTSNLDEAGGGADIVIPVVAPDSDSTKLVLNMAIHYATKGPLKDFVNVKQIEEARKKSAVTARSLFLLRPNDGRMVEIRAVIAAPGGRGLVGYHVPECIIDEAERMRTASEAGITDKEQIDAVRPALLPGGSIALISTPYDLDSYMHQFVDRNFGHPVDGIACVATTRELRPDSTVVQQMIATALINDPAVAMRDYECIPLGRPDSYFAPMLVDKCARDSSPRMRARVSAACDLAFVNDGCALVVIERQGDQLVQVYERFIKPSPTTPLQPSLVRAEFRDTIRAHGCNTCAADVHEFASLCETLIPAGIQVTHAPTGQNVTSAFAVTRDLMRSERLFVLPETARQLKSVLTKPDGAPNLPRSKEGHVDLVSALVAAVWLDRRHGAMDSSGGSMPGTLRGSYTT